MLRFRRRKKDPYAELRRKMIRETEIALAIGVQFPERVRRIPTIEVGHAGFARAFAERFWEEVLELNVAEKEALRQLPTFNEPVIDLIEM